MNKPMAVVILVAAAGWAGCYDAKQVNVFLQQDCRPVSVSEYRVYPPDAIGFESRHVPEINNNRQQVRPDGKVNLPLLGEIEVAGLTPAEIEERVKQAAKAYYEEVDCTVSMVGYNSQRYYIFGQVASPGPKTWTGRDTLLDALAAAQPTILAWPERIKLVRGDQPQVGGRCAESSATYSRTGVHPETPDNPRHEMVINLMAMINSGDLTNNVLLRPNDVIYVQANPLAKVGLALQNLLFPIRPAIETAGVPTASGL